MSTATLAAANGLGSDQGAFMRAVDSKFASTSPKAALAAGVARGRDLLSMLATKLHLAGAIDWTRAHIVPRLGWVAGVVKDVGPNTILAYAMTTHEGRNAVLHRIPATVYKVAMTPVRFVGRQIAKVTRRCGKHAQIATAAVPMFLERAEETVTNKVEGFDEWLADRHDSTWMSTTRSLTFLMIGTRLIQRFIPVGWMRWVAYSAIPFMPTTRSTTIDRAGVAVTRSHTIASTVADTVLGTDRDVTVEVIAEAPIGLVPTVAEGGTAEVPPAASESIPGANRSERRENTRLAASGGQGKRSQGPHARTPNHKR